jgi:hypothetical protein
MRLIAFLLGTALTLASCAGEGKAGDPDAFFNGRDLSGWEGRRDLWKVENGEIVGKAAPLAGVEYLVCTRPVDDFRLTLEVKLAGERGNGGLQFRSEKVDVTDMKGYQADVGPGAWGRLIERNGRGPLVDRGAEEAVKPDAWNLYEILATGGRIQLALNGKQCVDFTDPKPVRRGLIGLQMAGDVESIEIRFRNLALETHPEPRLKTVR